MGWRQRLMQVAAVVGLAVTLTATVWSSPAASEAAGRIGSDVASRLDVGGDSSCAVLADGSARCWGEGTFGELGDGGTADQPLPVDVALPAGRTAVDISVGFSHGCAVLDDGSVVCWGVGPLGDGSTAFSPAPVLVQLPAGRSAVSVTAGNSHTCAALDDGTVQCWGANALGQMGDGARGAARLLPSGVALPGAVVAVAAGGTFTCAVLDDGSAWCWGSNDVGELGIGTADFFAHAPAQVDLPVGRSVVALAAGSGRSACAVLDDGSAMCWGSNRWGQLGNGGTDDSPVPVPVSLPEGRSARSVATQGHSCAVLDDGSVACWGLNNAGQLGDGSANDSAVPVPVSLPAGRSALAVSGGVNHTCAVLDRGDVACWGRNSAGQLGDGTTTGSPTPVIVALGGPVTGPFVVTTTADDGEGSLRQALLGANERPGPDDIHFAIPGPGPHTIALESLLPTVTESVVVDGRTQPGYAGLPLVEITGGGAVPGGILAQADDVTIAGLSIHGFVTVNLVIFGDRATVVGNHVGTGPTGIEPVEPVRPTNNAAIGSDEAQIGGPDPADANVFVGGAQHNLYETGDNVVQGNFIGVDRSGTAALGASTYGLIAFDDGEVIGNRIAATEAGIAATSTDLRIEGNTFNLLEGGAAALPDAGAGVYLYGSRNVEIRSNRFGPGTAAVRVDHDSSEGVHVTGNSYVGPYATPAIIDLLPEEGRTLNDDLDVDEGPNHLQNHPVLTAAEGNAMSGTLFGVPGETVTIEVIGGAYGEPLVPIAETTVTLDPDTGGSAWSATSSSFIDEGWTVIATATADDGSTSETSDPISLPDGSPPVIVRNLTPPTPPSGWHTTDVSLSWTVTEVGSALETTGCEPVAITTDGSSSHTCTATSAGGTASDSVTITRDATAPTITGSVSPGMPDGWFGWYVTAAKVSFDCDDATSGVASCSEPVTLVSSPNPQSVSGTAVDLAGHTASTSVDGIRVDLVDPAVTCPSPTPSYVVGQSGATISVSVTDADSGPVSHSLTHPAFTALPGSYTESFQAFDVAGRNVTVACPYTVGKIATTLVATPVRVNSLLGLVSVYRPAAVLTRTDTGAPIAGEPIALTRGSTTCTATTDAQGQAVCGGSSLVLLGFVGAGPYSAAYAGDDVYLPSTDDGTIP